MDERMLEKIKNTYKEYDKCITYNHVVRVGKVARQIAKKYDLDENKILLASLLHDVSAIMPAKQMYQIAKQRNMVIDPAEEKYHFLLHQRISRILANEMFGITDEDILSAIECHTTLKKAASDYDKVVFLADKIAWDQEGQPPYYQELLKAVDISLDMGCYYFIKYQLDNKQLLMPHKWLIEAYQELSQKCS